MLHLDGIDVEEIATALADQTDYQHRWLLDPRTGQVAFWTSDTGIDGENPVEIDELDLIPIDPLPSYVWYQDMADFAEGISDGAAGRVESTDVVCEAVTTGSGVDRLGHRRLDEVGDGDGISAAGAGAAGSDASAGSLALWAPLLAGEALSAFSAFVDGVFPDARTDLGKLWRRGRWAGSTSVGCLSAGMTAVALVGAPMKRFTTDCAAGRCHVAVTGRGFRH